MSSRMARVPTGKPKNAVPSHASHPPPTLLRQLMLSADNERDERPDRYDNSNEDRTGNESTQRRDLTGAASTDVPEVEAIDDICKGVVFASLAITDNNRRTLKKVAKANPWHEQALKMITGSATMAHAPLEMLLSASVGLELDKIIDVQGVTPGGHFLDTQGYIAHNDDVVVLSYRCTTSAFDWLTNFNTTSSVWEIKEDVEQGFSGYCSGFSGWCCTAETFRPRVHTGFYNNFLATVPDIRQYIHPYLEPNQPPRKLYVVGHSLGAAVATLAGCYFATEFDWNQLPHTLVNVTAGSPRACCESMKEFMDLRMQHMSPLKCRLYRVKLGRDVVTNVPPKSLGFRHLVDSVKLQDDKIYWDKTGRASSVRGSGVDATDSNDADNDHKRHQTRNLPEDDLSSLAAVVDEDAEPQRRTGSKEDADEKYRHFVSKVPKSLRDHMPDFYLRPLMRARGVNRAIDLCAPPIITEDASGRQVYVMTETHEESTAASEAEFTETESEGSGSNRGVRRGLFRRLSGMNSKESGRPWFGRLGRKSKKRMQQ